MIYAYARVSTKKQDVCRQLDIIKKRYSLPEENFVCEVYSGREMNRPEWQRLKKILKSGDTVVFESVSRMARNAEEGIADYLELYNAGVELVFINEPHIDTKKYRSNMEQIKQKAVSLNVATGDMMVDKLLNFFQDWINDFMSYTVKRDIEIEFEKAEAEIENLSQRTIEGMKSKGAAEKISNARKGKKFRTVPSLKTRIKILKQSVRFGGILNDVQLAKILDVSRRTVIRYSDEMNEQLSTMTKDKLLENLKQEIKDKNQKHNARHT